MQTNNSLGFVVWGVKNGFQNNLFSHNLSESIRTTLIDIQELCMPQYSDFYSIERIGGDTLVSLYDPTMMDYSGSRKAYIVFSIIFPQGIAPSADVFELLGSFKNYYKVESNGLPSQEIFHRKLIEFNVKSSTPPNSSGGTQIGFKNYVSFDEIKEVFTDLDILDYRKIYFFDRPNSYVTSNPNFIAVTSLERKYSVQIHNYNAHDYQILINGITATSSLVRQVAQGKVEITDLNKIDKIEIKRGGAQLIESFYVRDRQHVTLPLPKVDHPSHFTIRNFDSSRYRVMVNKQEQPTSDIIGSELKVAISTEHVFVEIVDKQTNAVVQTHDTRINKTYVMLFQGGNVTNRPPVGGGNSGGSSIGFTEKPKKKSKAGLILVLSSGVLLTGLIIAGWQLRWFEGQIKHPPGAGTTTNAEPTNGTGNVTVNPQPIENSPLNPEGYTVESGSDAILTEKGLLHSNNRYYRYLNGQWEFSEKSNQNNWKRAEEQDINLILKKYFIKVKTPIQPGPQPPQPPGPQPPKPPVPQPPKPPKDPNECSVNQIKLNQIKADAGKAKTLNPQLKKKKAEELLNQVKSIKNSTPCPLDYSSVELAISNLN
jgi:hypothetical protein